MSSLRRDGEDVADVPRGIDDETFARLVVAEQVHEVLHLARERMAAREVAASEELPEVEPIFHHLFPSFCFASFAALDFGHNRITSS